ncbi:MAG TPA: peroxiredoxin-like family protein [Opitutaceae bacterium]|nr:peroxiredoxin-like family protein [Opitutaceae bacterium]
MKVLRLLTGTLVAAFFAMGAARALPIAESADMATPLKKGTQNPAATVRAVDGAVLNLRDITGTKPTILIFFRGGWCPYCNRHLADLQSLEPKLTALGYQIVALSTDKPSKLQPTVAKLHLGYQLYSDRDMFASHAYGVAFHVARDSAMQMIDKGIDLAPVPGEGDSYWLPIPSVFIIGKDGNIKFVHSEPDYKVRLPGSELLSAAENAR